MHDAVLFCICSSTKLIIGSVRKARCVFPGNRRGKMFGDGFSQESGAGKSREELSGIRRWKCLKNVQKEAGYGSDSRISR